MHVQVHFASTAPRGLPGQCGMGDQYRPRPGARDQKMPIVRVSALLLVSAVMSPKPSASIDTNC